MCAGMQFELEKLQSLKEDNIKMHLKKCFDSEN